jgi:hypothetical protein
VVDELAKIGNNLEKLILVIKDCSLKNNASQ